jgi:transcriptional regulator with XRE-family HTH domain
MNIVQILVRRRKSYGLRQVDVAVAIGTGQSQISEYERGVQQPTLGVLVRWAQFLDLDLALIERMS